MFSLIQDSCSCELFQVYVYGLDFLRLGVINPFVRGLDFLRLGVINPYVQE